MKKVVSLTLSLAMLLSLAACGGTGGTSSNQAPQDSGSAGKPARQNYDLVAAAGNSGSAGNSLVSAMCQIVQTNVSGVTMTPNDTNTGACPEAIQGDVVQAGITTTANMADAMQGVGDYSQVCDKPMQMLYLYDFPMHIFLRADDNITSMEQLKGQPIGSLTAGSFATVIVDKLLPYYDMTWDDFSQVNYGTGSEMINMLKNRQIKMTFAANIPPHNLALDLESSTTMSLMDLPEDIIQKFCADHPAYSEYIIPGGTYEDVAQDIHTISSPYIFVISSDIPEDVVYEMTKSLCENVDQLGNVIAALKDSTPELLGTQTSVPIHPGAEKYFKEIGVL